MKNIIKDLFSWKGRINRLKFWIYQILIIVLVSILLVLAFAILYGAGESEFIIIIGLVLLILVWIASVIVIKRFHDLNRTGWWTIIYYIPYISIIPLIYIGFFKGTQGENRFGPDPLMGSEKKVEEKVEL